MQLYKTWRFPVICVIVTFSAASSDPELKMDMYFSLVYVPNSKSGNWDFTSPTHLILQNQTLMTPMAALLRGSCAWRGSSWMMYDLSLLHWGCQGLKIVPWGGRLYWGPQLGQDTSEWQCWLVAAGKALCPAQVRDKALMGMLESAAENEADRDRMGRRKGREEGWD